MLTRSIVIAAALLLASTAHAAGPYQPPGANLTLGDVSHGLRVRTATSNPAAAAAEAARAGGNTAARGTVLTGAGGIEYGNVDNLFELYDEISGAYKPSDPDDGVDLPGQLPEQKPGGIDLGQIWNALDPDVQAAIETLAREVATQTAALLVIGEEAYARAWLAADAPVVLGGNALNGTWTFGVSWSGSSRAFGVVQAIQFDRDVARQALEDWFNDLPINRPPVIELSEEVQLVVDPVTNAVLFTLENDSSLISKSTQTTRLSLGYSRPAWASERGTLYLGAEAHAYIMELSRYTARLGDITDAEALFDEIRNADFRTDERLGLDVGALWVGENYQLGAQITNVNEPKFTFPEVNLTPYRTASAIQFLVGDAKYVMDRQLKLEGSWFSRERRWSAHFGIDADSVKDPLGDRYQWVTLSGNFSNEDSWLPGARIGVRHNLAGTEKTYLSLGVTAFEFFNFDISSALDTVEISGDTLPQGLMASIGFRITW